MFVPLRLTDAQNQPQQHVLQTYTSQRAHRFANFFHFRTYFFSDTETDVQLPNQPLDLLICVDVDMLHYAIAANKLHRARYHCMYLDKLQGPIA